MARVFLRPGSGKVIVNGRRFEEYFPGEGMRLAVRQPLVSTENRDSFDLKVNVLGGGIYGQSIAVRLGVARALLVYNPDLRPYFAPGRVFDAGSACERTQEIWSEGSPKALPVLKAVRSVGFVLPCCLFPPDCRGKNSPSSSRIL